jgi:hypothetical protein
MRSSRARAQFKYSQTTDSTVSFLHPDEAAAITEAPWMVVGSRQL